MITSTLQASAARPSAAKAHRIILAASIGNALEWFDLVVYGFFAVTIAKLFFPARTEAISLMLTLGTFGISYLIRPLGGLVLGSLADRAGRKISLLLSIGLMMIGTLTIAVMPPYAAIGLWAPAGIMVSRLVQGFSAGGEFGASTAFLVEHAPERRGFMGSWQFASQGLATLLASGFGALLTSQLTAAQLESWGWRIPFLFGLAIGPVGFYIRRYVDEGAEFDTEPKTRTPLGDLFGTQKVRILLAVGSLVISTAANYMILYMPTYAIKQLHLPASTGFAATLATGIVLTVLTPFAGHLSDSMGRIRIMALAATLMLLTVYPTFVYMNAHPSFATMLLALIWIGVLKATYFGALPALMSEIFPTQTRATGLAVSYNYWRDGVRRLCALRDHLADRRERQHTRARLLSDVLRGGEFAGALCGAIEAEDSLKRVESDAPCKALKLTRLPRLSGRGNRYSEPDATLKHRLTHRPQGAGFGCSSCSLSISASTSGESFTSALAMFSFN